MAPKAKKAADDFVLTISDTEDAPNFEESSDEELGKEELKPEPKQTKKASKKAGKKAKKQEQSSEEEKEKENDVDPDFQFDLDGFATTNLDEEEGWNFGGDADKQVSTSVDLDEIIRQKGGLEAYESEKEEEEEEDEDDDDLALDGFGMGAGESQTKNDEEDDEEKEGTDNEEEEHVDEDDEEEEASETEEKVDEDTAEEIANFYAPSDEAESAKQSIHTSFQTLNLSRPVMKGLSSLNYATPSPIQSAVIPVAVMGKDVVAGAVTGSGKTAAYLIPILERLVYLPRKVPATRVVVLTPTRELAIQVADVGKKLGQYISGMRFGLAVGGLNLRVQEQELKTRPDIVIATPGRFIDHVRNSPSFQVDSVEILVVDEADRMLEEGFQKELTEILQLIPTKRQTLLFSATMNNRIKDLVQLSLHRPVRIMINPPKQAAGGLIQEFVRVRTKRTEQKPAVLAWLLKKLSTSQRVIVFVARKETAHKLRIVLGLLGMKIGELHGALTQEQRLQSVTNFKNLTVPVLICTDLASRGLDIPKIEVVINYDMPKTYEVYLHRVGRTARAGREGKSISLVGEAGAERAIVKESIKSVNAAKDKASKIVGRNVDWPEIDKLFGTISDKEETIAEILEEEKTQKLIAQAERDIQKSQNLIKHEAEIKSRPKRTWFESEAEKKQDKATNKKKQKIGGDDDGFKSAFDAEPRMYKKTKKDRMENQKRGKNGNKGKSKVKKNDKKTQAKIARAKKYKK
ncbi:hypothetical protein D0Z00_003472 [Geotrichum galactomycetum]|uniref:Uncharacterized protein n=1 Tax=Geotrichum galactomycetum TaxID=27317 RepID=A0ACB6V176_9ASCO|nr:hypothetical protein D0Z00_003472 [Geotrichum candidum]